MDDQTESCSSNTLVQCRICHDEDLELNMDTPCSCSGTLQYAHRICVQRWCNEKGDTTCEICQQQFKGYTPPPQAPLFRYRGNWEIPRIGFNNHQLIALFPANHEFLDFDFEYSASSRRSRLFIRIVAIIFIVLLVLRHTLSIVFILDEFEETSLTVITLLMWGVTGIIVPVYIMVKAIQQLQNQNQNPLMQLRSLDENNMRQSQLRVIHIQ
ncbi:uncharacterized protein LOC131626946 [Vicia villosa]|uniref:uncharacterized protein LOC131626946 n=1 Tax=Vicia villosa TaxID=3911 RepID=UPI00273CA048|nr:uncharacterized protein LOC131626946 [Vicia villosa]